MSPELVTNDKCFPFYQPQPYRQLYTSSQLANPVGSGWWADVPAVSTINKTTVQLLMPLHGLFTVRFNCSEKLLKDYNAVYTRATLSYAKPASTPYSMQTVHGFFSAQLFTNQCYETGPAIDQAHPRRLQSLTICRCQYKDSTFFSVIIAKASSWLNQMGSKSNET